MDSFREYGRNREPKQEPERCKSKSKDRQFCWSGLEWLHFAGNVTASTVCSNKGAIDWLATPAYDRLGSKIPFESLPERVHVAYIGCPLRRAPGYMPAVYKNGQGALYPRGYPYSDFSPLNRGPKPEFEGDPEED